MTLVGFEVCFVILLYKIFIGTRSHV